MKYILVEKGSNQDRVRFDVSLPEDFYSKKFTVSWSRLKQDFAVDTPPELDDVLTDIFNDLKKRYPLDYSRYAALNLPSHGTHIFTLPDVSVYAPNGHEPGFYGTMQIGVKVLEHNIYTELPYGRHYGRFNMDHHRAQFLAQTVDLPRIELELAKRYPTGTGYLFADHEAWEIINGA